jgi:hypothetical protein
MSSVDKIIIRPSEPYRVAKAVAIASFIFTLIVLMRPSQWPVLAFLYSLLFTTLWSGRNKGRSYTVVDTEKQLVLVHTASILGKIRTSCYDIPAFGSVISYVVVGKNPQNRVELVTHSGGEALLLGEFAPSRETKSFFSLSTGTSESGEAEKLRLQISHACKLKDRGFLGTRWVGAQLKATGTRPMPNRFERDQNAPHSGPST